MVESGKVSEDFPHQTYAGQGDGEADSGSDSVQSTVYHSVLVGESLGSSEHDAVNHNQRDEDTQSLVKTWRESLHNQLNHGYEGSYHDDVARYPDLVRNSRSKERDNYI